jgi:opacity protein-like surface antigen
VKRTVTSGGEPFTENRNQFSRTWKIGALGVAGVEWFATKGVSFHAEYRSSLRYGKTKQESLTDRPSDPSYYRKDESTTSSWDFQGVAVTFGVSLYF